MNKTGEWMRSFNGVGLKLEPQVVRVSNDFVLDVYLQRDPKNCMRLAKYIKSAYARKFNEPLQISAKSLAIEIYGHYKMQKVAEKTERLVGKKKFTSWLINHTTVIDCGSLAKDNNRVIWDGMERVASAEAMIKAKLPTGR